MQSDVENEFIDEPEEDSHLSSDGEDLPARTSERDQLIIIQTGRVINGRTFAVNIIRFDLFITDEIVHEIIQWTTGEIAVKRHITMISATYRDTNATEFRALNGVLKLSTAMKDDL